MKYLKVFFVVSLLLTSTLLFAWKVDDRILGKWSDELWYPARITAGNGDIFKVAFDDGDTAELSSSDMKKIDWKIGTVLECNWENKGAYYQGKITKKKGDIIHVVYDDGDEEDTLISSCRSQ